MGFRRRYKVFNTKSRGRKGKLVLGKVGEWVESLFSHFIESPSLHPSQNPHTPPPLSSMRTQSWLHPLCMPLTFFSEGRFRCLPLSLSLCASRLTGSPSDPRLQSCHTCHSLPGDFSQHIPEPLKPTWPHSTPHLPVRTSHSFFRPPANVNFLEKTICHLWPEPGSQKARSFDS